MINVINNLGQTQITSYAHKQLCRIVQFLLCGALEGQ